MRELSEAEFGLVSGGQTRADSYTPRCPNYPIEGDCRLPSGTIVRDGVVVDDGSIEEARRITEGATRGLVGGAIGGIFTGSPLGIIFGAAGGWAGGAAAGTVRIRDIDPPEDSEERDEQG